MISHFQQIDTLKDDPVSNTIGHSTKAFCSQSVAILSVFCHSSNRDDSDNSDDSKESDDSNNSNDSNDSDASNDSDLKNIQISIEVLNQSKYLILISNRKYNSLSVFPKSHINYMHK